jgi:hypothetical protein
MPLLEQQNVLAKIYTDERFRKDFLANPFIVGETCGLTTAESEEISRIMPAELVFFAESLFFKRLHEVRKTLPFTEKAIGKTEFERYFREFSESFQPTATKKHLEDSFEFCKFLEQKTFEMNWQREIIKLEKAKLEFFGYGKSFVICWFQYDLRNLPDITKLRRHRFGIKKPSIWIRFMGRIWHRLF